MFDRTLDALARLCLRHSRQIAIVATLLAIGAIAAATRLAFDPDLLNLIPQNNQQVNDFRRALRDMGTIDNHIVIVHIPKGHDVHEYDSLVEEIANGYKKSRLIEDVNYRLPNPLDFVDVILPRAFLFLSPEQLPEVAQKLSDAGIRESVQRNRMLLQTPQSFALKQLIQYDPFNLAPIFLKKFQAASGGFNIDASSGYYLSNDHEMLLILTKPRRPAQDVPFGKQLEAESAIIESRALKDFQITAPAGTPSPMIEHTGGYTIAIGDADLIRGDVIINVLGSFFGVLALFIYGFRRMASLFYAALPMALALALTFGVAGLVYGTLSSASAGFAALLAGLGIDFITVLYGRYVGERNRGATMAHGLIVAIRTTMPGIFVAALTTSATFYAFLATDFRGMTQLGFLTGTGILFFLLSVAFLLPALIVISERRSERRAPKLYLHSFGSDKLIDLSIAKPVATIIAWTVFVVICCLLATRLRFSDNIQDLRAKGNIGVINQERVTQKFGTSFEFMMYVVQGRSLNDVLEKTRAASADLDPLVANKTIASYQSISTFVPARDQQLAIIGELDRDRSGAFGYDRIDKTFREALVTNGFRPEAYDRYLETFRQTLSPKEPVTISNIGNEDILKLTTRFVKQTGGGWMSVIYVYPVGGRWPREVPAQLLAVPARHPGDVLTGVNLVSGTLRRIVKADATRSTILGFFIVLGIMFLGFRSVKFTLLAFLPFFAGAAGMLGLMALFNLEFNFMNIFVGLMIISCGTDYAVYMSHRFLEHPGTFHETAGETGKAVVMAALTTIVGYGSFALSHYPGLRSIGYASFFGIALSGLAAITLLPAILVLGRNDEHDSSSAQ
ncbi:MAG TPA: MMPL family transporter [Thermoanaerobaculia bacterium]|nr:MMPL family transporter [Thermoanaerobaculia bacterium]